MQFSQGKKASLSRVSLDIRPLKDERKGAYMKRFPRLACSLIIRERNCEKCEEKVSEIYYHFSRLFINYITIQFYNIVITCNL